MTGILEEMKEEIKVPLPIVKIIIMEWQWPAGRLYFDYFVLCIQLPNDV